VSTVPSLRERKKQQTRVDLVRAAFDLFAERGFDSTTIDDIAERANYSRRTFFRHFATKEDVAFEDAFEQLAGFEAALQRRRGEADPIRVLREELTTVARSFGGEPIDRAAVGLWFTEPALQRRYLEMVQSWEAVAGGFLEEEIPDAPVLCGVVATAMCGVVKAVLSLRLEDEDAVVQALKLGFSVVNARPLRQHARTLK